MQFINNAPVYKLVRVTGPQHNLLVLQFSGAAVAGSVRLEALDATKEFSNPIEGQEVLGNVAQAIEDFKAQTGKQYFLEAIQYMAGDSHPAEVYYEMTKEIIRRIELQSD